MTEEVGKLLEKADHALEVAQELQKKGYAPDAASKTYYAMFYAAQALLKTENIHVVKHSAVESAFGYHFVKPGRMDPVYHKMLMEARRIREIADYDIQEEVIEPDAQLKVEEGKKFVQAIKNLLESQQG